MQSQKGNIATVFGVVIFLGLMAGSYFYLSNQKAPTSPAPPSIEALPAVADNAQGGFKVYSGSKFAEKYGPSYNFSIEYPEDWTPRDHDYGTGVEIAFLSPNYKTPETGAGEEVLSGGRIELSVLPNQNFTALDEWAKNFYTNPRTSKTFINPQSKTMGDKQLLEFNYNDNESGKIDMISSNSIDVILFAIEDSIYQFRIVSNTKTPEYSKVVEEMIESLKSP